MDCKRNILLVSLCSGIGAFECALAPYLTPQDNLRVCYSEIKDAALSVYKHNFPHAKWLGPVQSITEASLEEEMRWSDVQILCAGFPCQNISMANNVTRTGLDGEKSSLFHEIIRVANIMKKAATRFFVILENVRGSRETLDTITATLRETLPRDKIFMTPLDSALCSCQARTRMFWTNFPIDKLKTNTCSRTLSDVLLPVEEIQARWREVSLTDKFVRMYNKIMNEKNAAKTLVAEKSTSADLWVFKTQQDKPRSRWQKYPLSDSSNSRSKTITTNHPNFHLIDRRLGRAEGEFAVRKFLPEELEQLFGFPVSWTAKGANDRVLTFNERVDLLGNSIVVPVAEHIFSFLFKL